MSELELAVWGCGGVALACWALSVITREYSWVDRAWSLLPPLYVTYFAWSRNFEDARVDLMLMLSWLWGARLTYNFARKGGYAAGGEDYRWAELRRRMKPWQFQVFNFFFTAGFQNALLLALAVPAVIAARGGPTPLGVVDWIFAALFLVFLAGETIADNQQWRFQTEKKAKRARGEPVEQEFLTTGLFAYSRHPNFLCEQAQWWVFYALGVHASGAWLGVGVIGAAVLTALFHGSTQFTEELSLAKYPSYAEYQRRVSRLLPLPTRPQG